MTTPATALPSTSATHVALIRGQLPRPCTPDADTDAITRLYASLASDGTPFARFMAARTGFFDRELLASLEAGIGQVVVLAAGYDDRTLRFKVPGVRYFELDLAPTQDDKIRRLRGVDADVRHVAFAPADFTVDRVFDVLARTAFDRGRPGIFLCEGALLYLPFDAVSRLLTDVRACAAPGSALVVSFAIGAQTPPTQPKPNKSGEYRLTFFTASSVDALLCDCGWMTAKSEPALHNDLVEVAMFVHAVPREPCWQKMSV